jgi:hypothetical protein
VTYNAGERLVEKHMQCSLDLIKVVLMDAVEQAAVDQAEDVRITDLYTYNTEPAGTPIAKPPLPDCFRAIARHGDPPFGSEPVAI